MGRRRCGRALPFFGAPPIVCTIGLRSAEGGGRWSCLTLSVRVCVCVCARMSVCLSLSHGPVAAGQGQGQEQRFDEAAWACRVGHLPRLTNFGPFLGQEWLTKTRTVLQYWRVTGGWGLQIRVLASLPSPRSTWSQGPLRAPLPPLVFGPSLA